MCSIGGAYLRSKGSFELRQNLERLLRIQRLRGPDNKGRWIDERGVVGLCHNRLAVIDQSEAGNQPMSSYDKRYKVVFNGEIYNYIELRRILAAKGVQFRTRTDTEVLIEAYRYWGEEMVDNLRGMFAFAIFDLEEKTLFCARDRVGKKPFIYAETVDGFFFASQIAGIMSVPGVVKKLNHSAITAMLLHNMRHIPDPYTAYQGIKRLRAGHALLVRDGNVVKMWRYWTPRYSRQEISPGKLLEILEESVQLRMRSDVPVAALLSGGVDSSAIVALMKRFTANQIQTYAIGLDRDDEDIRRARVMAKELGTIHKEIYYEPKEQWDIFKELIGIHGEPIMLLPLIHTYLLCRAIRDDGIKVVMSGNGADELFYGYAGHTNTLRLSRWLERAAVARPILRKAIRGKYAFLSERPGRIKAKLYESYAIRDWGKEIRNEKVIGLDNVTAEEMRYWGELCPSTRYIDESNFVGLMVENTHSVTTVSDLSAMAASVEMRCPFLDQEVVSFALDTPVEEKIPSVKNREWLKAILREAVVGLVPYDLLSAPKRGMGMGIQEKMVLDGPWRSMADELFSSPDDCDGLFDVTELKRIWKDYKQGNAQPDKMAKLMAIQVWLKTEKE